MDKLHNYIADIASSGSNEVEFDVNYADRDILFFENIKMLSDPEMSRIKMNLVAFCHKGKALLLLNNKPVSIHTDEIFISPSHTTFSDIMMSPDCEFKLLFVSNNMLQSMLKGKMHIWIDLIYKHNVRVIALEDPEDRTFLLHLSEIAKLLMQGQESNTFKEEIKQSILRACFLGFLGIIIRKDFPDINETGIRWQSQNQLFRRFIDMLQHEKVQHKPVDYYSNELCISSKYLSTICKKQSGKTASEWICEHLLEDIRYYLKETNYSVKEICNFLGFSNQSFFGKYVKHHFGMTPLEVRKRTK